MSVGCGAPSACTEYVLAGGTANGTVLSGGAEEIYGGGTGITVSSGGVLYIGSGGSASDTRVSAGAVEYVFLDGLDSGGTILADPPLVAETNQNTIAMPHQMG